MTDYPYLRSRPLASTYFKANGGTATKLSALPRYKFMYYAKFIPSAAALAMYQDKTDLKYADLGSYENGISFKIHSIDKPRIDLNVTELNQYNRKRYAYTRVEYQPFNIKIHDTVDDIPLKMWRDYFTYYFGDSRTKSSGIYGQSVTADSFGYDTGWGFNPKANAYNFFDRVELYALFGKRYTQINYINPKIISVDWSGYDSSSSDLGDVSMTLRYEAVEYPAMGQKMRSTDLTKFGFNVPTPVLEVDGLGAPKDDMTSWTPAISAGNMLLNVLNNARQPASNPTDLTNAISSTMTVANSTLNMFSGSSIGAISQSAGYVIGQSNQPVTATTGISNGQLSTNPSMTSSFMGASTSSLPNPAGGSIGQFGSFNFGNSR